MTFNTYATHVVYRVHQYLSALSCSSQGIAHTTPIPGNAWGLWPFRGGKVPSLLIPYRTCMVPTPVLSLSVTTREGKAKCICWLEAITSDALQQGPRNNLNCVNRSKRKTRYANGQTNRGINTSSRDHNYEGTQSMVDLPHAS